ncbi:MAG: PAS domain S-box protein [Candidatus Krumholzibacteriota bacterium]|nr:PAS domain S-box protein [Candidatus Krumholzibacteriota bacterium]
MKRVTPAFTHRLPSVVPLLPLIGLGLDLPWRSRLFQVEAFLLVVIGFVFTLALRRRAGQTAAALARSEERFRALVEDTDDLVWEADGEGRVTYAGPRVAKLLGREAGAIRGCRLAGLVVPEDRERVEGLLARMRREPERLSLEFTMPDRDGRRVVFEANLSPISDAAGRFTGSRGYARDVTARRHVEDELRLFKTIADTANYGTGIADREGRVLYVNETLAAMHGYRPEDLIGGDGRELYGDEYGPQARALEEIIRRDGGFVAREVWHRRRDGSRFPALENVKVLAGEDGQPLFVVTTLVDISERKASERALQNAMEEAERARRRLETSNQQLAASIRHAKRMASEADSASRAKGEFLANVSHEIRTPLNGIIGMAELLRARDLTAEQRDHVEVLHGSAVTLLGIINEVLDFSKMEAGKLELDVRPFELRRAVEEVVELLAPQAARKRLEFICFLQSELPLRVRGDRRRLQQVLMNLAGNAVKFTERGEVLIRVGLDRQDAQRCRFRFSVSDTGIGIPAASHGQLFDSFTQVDASTSRKYGGTGLGLAIAKRLVMLMGGEIGLVSEEGSGSTFWFTLSLETEAPDGAAAPWTGGAGRRVLVAEGNASARLVHAEMLRACGCRPESVEAGEEVLPRLRAAVAAGDPHAILLADAAVLQGEPGEELAEARRREPALAATVPILLAPHGAPNGEDTLRRDLAAERLTKPLRQGQLGACLARVLESDGAPAPGEATPPAGAAADRPRALLVEDNPTNRVVALEQLRKLELEVEAVPTGEAALAALRERDFDVVIMDVQMPDLDGVETTRRIRDPRSGVRNRDVPVIALTAHGLEENRRRCLEAGMDDFLGKPIQLSQLHAAVFRALGGCGEPAAACAGGGCEDEAIFERADFLDRLGGDEELLEELVAFFITETPNQVEALRQAILEGDREAVTRLAHTLKGSSANVGAAQVRRIAAVMEADGREDRLGGMTARLRELEKALERFRDEIHP